MIKILTNTSQKSTLQLERNREKHKGLSNLLNFALINTVTKLSAPN